MFVPGQGSEWEDLARGGGHCITNRRPYDDALEREDENSYLDQITAAVRKKSLPLRVGFSSIQAGVKNMTISKLHSKTSLKLDMATARKRR